MNSLYQSEQDTVYVLAGHLVQPGFTLEWVEKLGHLGVIEPRFEPLEAHITFYRVGEA